MTSVISFVYNSHQQQPLSVSLCRPEKPTGYIRTRRPKATDISTLLHDENIPSVYFRDKRTKVAIKRIQGMTSHQDAITELQELLRQFITTPPNKLKDYPIVILESFIQELERAKKTGLEFQEMGTTGGIDALRHDLLSLAGNLFKKIKPQSEANSRQIAKQELLKTPKGLIKAGRIATLTLNRII